MKNKIYIAGCGGMLGDAFYKQFNKKYELKCSDIDVNEDWLSYLDFRDFKDYKNYVMILNQTGFFTLVLIQTWNTVNYTKKIHTRQILIL